MSAKKRFLLRINEDLYGVLEKWASDDLRSINAQIEYLLSESARAAHRWRTPVSYRGEQHSFDPGVSRVPVDTGCGHGAGRGPATLGAPPGEAPLAP